jgi:AcrR family transcriptional regulator
MGASPPEGLRERTRRAVRVELMVTAVELFTSQGYAETTVGEIAAAAGMSERSFFRYFATKEDVVLGGFELVGQALADRLAQLPPDLPAWPALRAAFDGVADRYDNDPERNLAVLRLRTNTPALTAHYLEQRSRWQELMVPHLLSRLPGESGDAAVRPDPRPDAVAGAALACLGAAETAWMHGQGSVPFSTLLDLAMGALSPQTAEDARSPYLTNE